MSDVAAPRALLALINFLIALHVIKNPFIDAAPTQIATGLIKFANKHAPLK